MNKLLRWLFPPPKRPALKWRTQLSSWNRRENSLVHFAAWHRGGYFEIYETPGEKLLMCFPRLMDLPADVYETLDEAKAGRKALEAPDA